MSNSVNIEVETPSNPRRKWWRRSLKIGGIIALILLILTAIFIIWMGPIVEWYIERNDKELTSRRIEMDNLRLRLFDGTATADNIILYEADETTPFASIDRMEADIDVSEIFSGHIHITRVHLTRPYLSIIKDGDVYNFTDMVEYIFVKYILPGMIEEQVGGGGGGSGEDDDEWVVTVENVTFEDGHIIYLDKNIDQRWELTAMNLHTDELIMDDAMSTFDTKLRINDKSTVEGMLSFNYDTSDFDFKGRIDNFDLADTYKHWLPHLNISSIDGIAEVDAHVVGNFGEIMAMDIAGEFTISGAKIRGIHNRDILYAEQISGSIENINIEHDIYRFNTLYANGYTTEFVLNSDGTTNFTGLFPENTDVSVETPAEELDNEIYDVLKQMRTTSDDEDDASEAIITIGDLSLTNGTVHYADNRSTCPFDYNISNLSIKSSQFDLDHSNSLTIQAYVPKQGSVSIRWEGSFNDLNSQSIVTISELLQGTIDSRTIKSDGGNNRYTVTLIDGEEIAIYSLGDESEEQE